MSTVCCFFFFFNDTATTEIYTLSLHDALPIFIFELETVGIRAVIITAHVTRITFEHGSLELIILELILGESIGVDRKSTRLNSSHANISYAVFCLKKKKTTKDEPSLA